MDMLKEINYCNSKGDVCRAKFSFKENIDNLEFEEFLSKLYDDKLGLVNINVEGLEINSLILYFKNFDFEKLNMIYNEGKRRDDNSIKDIILEYLDSFINFDYEIFCSADECKAIIKISKMVIFRNQESVVLKRIENSKRIPIIDDFIEYKKNSLNIIKQKKLECV